MHILRQCFLEYMVDKSTRFSLIPVTILVYKAVVISIHMHETADHRIPRMQVEYMLTQLVIIYCIQELAFFHVKSKSKTENY